MNIWLIIPVKSLRESKSRLANVLTGDQRRELTSHLLSRTIEVGCQVNSIQRILVVTPDPEVELLTRSQEVTVILEEERRGLNSALAQSRDFAGHYADWILILPCDLPFISVDDIERLLVPLLGPNTESPRTISEQNLGLMVICPDLHEDGTNALLLSKAGDFTFRFGENSFQKHLLEASNRGLKAARVHPEGIRFDLDSEDDWFEYLKRSSGVPLSKQLE